MTNFLPVFLVRNRKKRYVLPIKQAPCAPESEGAQSVPDMDKVVQMSRLFGVTTDFLLKDELSEEEPAPAGCDSPLRRVTMAEASEYLALRRAALRRGHAGGKAHRKEKVTAARYIEKCPFSERTDIFCVFAYRHSAQ